MNKLNLLSLPLSVGFLLNFQNHALAYTYSKPGIELIMTIPNLFGKTEPGNISGNYKSKNTNGILFDAPGPVTLGDSDIAFFNFVDTTGQDRCYGSTSMSSGGVNIWKVKGAIPGYSCSTIGKTYRFNFGK